MLIGLATVAVASPDAFYGARSMVANVIGVGASVPANPVNTYTAELDAREQELVLREQALTADRERTALWVALSVVAGLVAVNFVLDWRRNRA
jgi:hypothetical protein